MSGYSCPLDGLVSIAAFSLPLKCYKVLKVAKDARRMRNVNKTLLENRCHESSLVGLVLEIASGSCHSIRRSNLVNLS